MTKSPPPAISATSFARGDLGSDRVVLRSRSLGFVLDAGQLLADAHLEIAAELDVGAAAGHVGGDGHRAGPPAWAMMKASCS